MLIIQFVWRTIAAALLPQK